MTRTIIPELCGKIERTPDGGNCPECIEITETPASQLPTRAPREDAAQLIDRLKALLSEVPDDICLDDLLQAAGFPLPSLTGWHRARALDALLGPYPAFQAYDAGLNKLRYRRLPPLEACPGFGDEECSTLTRGGVLCAKHAEYEEEDIWFGQP
jgi:hypothetical protein